MCVCVPRERLELLPSPRGCPQLLPRHPAAYVQCLASRRHALLFAVPPAMPCETPPVPKAVHLFSRAASVFTAPPVPPRCSKFLPPHPTTHDSVSHRPNPTQPSCPTPACVLLSSPVCLDPTKACVRRFGLYGKRKPVNKISREFPSSQRKLGKASVDFKMILVSFLTSASPGHISSPRVSLCYRESPGGPGGRGGPGSTLHNFAVRSLNAVSAKPPSAEKATDKTGAWCPSSARRHSPDAALGNSKIHSTKS